MEGKFEGKKMVLRCYPNENYPDEMSVCEVEIDKKPFQVVSNHIQYLEIETGNGFIRQFNGFQIYAELKDMECEIKKSIMICRPKEVRKC